MGSCSRDTDPLGSWCTTMVGFGLEAHPAPNKQAAVRRKASVTESTRCRVQHIRMIVWVDAGYTRWPRNKEGKSLPRRGRRALAPIIHERFYCNRPFAAATNLHAASAACRRAGSPLSRSMYSQVRLPPSRLHAPVSRRDWAISQRTVTNNAGWPWRGQEERSIASHCTIVETSPLTGGTGGCYKQSPDRSFIGDTAACPLGSVPAAALFQDNDVLVPIRGGGRFFLSAFLNG